MVYAADFGTGQERYPPVIDDFLYVCDDAYNRQQFIDMEMRMLRALDFDLGIPLSYRFLRRYAKVQACCLHRPGFVHRTLTVVGWAMSPMVRLLLRSVLVSSCRRLFTVRSYRHADTCLQCARIEMPMLVYSALVSRCRRLFTVRWYRDVSACLQCARIEMSMLVCSALVSRCRLFTGRSYRDADADAGSLHPGDVAAGLLDEPAAGQQAGRGVAAARSHHEARVRLGEPTQLLRQNAVYSPKHLSLAVEQKIHKLCFRCADGCACVQL